MAASMTVELAAGRSLELVVRAHGDDVIHFESNGDTDLDTMVDDPVEVFAQAVRLGMLGEGTVSPLEKQANLHTQSQTWRCRTEGLECGAFRILVNMLAVRRLSSVEIIATAPGTAGSERLDFQQARYPRLPEPPGFAVEKVPPLRSSKNRVVQIIFANRLEIAVANAVCAAFDVWDRLMLACAYPLASKPPERAGAVGDPPFQLDAWTVEQSFPEVFDCDEASFDAILIYAGRLHEQGVLVERVRVG